MKQGLPIRREIRNFQNGLQRLCKDYSLRTEDSINPVLFSFHTDQVSLKVLSEDLTIEISNLIRTGIRDSIPKTIDDLMKKTGKTLDISERMYLEAKIENSIGRKYAGKTLQGRLKTSHRFTAQNLLRTYRLRQAGLNPSWYDTFLGSGQSIYFWNNRLGTTEILRTYHYTVQEFARVTKAKEISFRFDKRQLERRSEYRLLADGGPYKVDELPDYPRPYASYLLDIKY